MMESGNGAVQVCALNLLRTVRGEVPYARTKGIDRSLIDIPQSRSYLLRSDAEWTIENYEPRADLEDVVASASGYGDESIVAVLR